MITEGNVNAAARDAEQADGWQSPFLSVALAIAGSKKVGHIARFPT
ncbi:MAG: hypothetical protein ABIQ32_02265 [Sphingomicrobium sp.]